MITFRCKRGHLLAKVTHDYATGYIVVERPAAPALSPGPAGSGDYGDGSGKPVDAVRVDVRRWVDGEDPYGAVDVRCRCVSPGTFPLTYAAILKAEEARRPVVLDIPG